MSMPVGSHTMTSLDLVPKRFNLLVLIFFGGYFLLPFLRPLILDQPRLEYFSGFIVFNFFLAAFIGGTAKELLCRPLSVTLPFQKQYLRRHLLVIAAVMNLLYAGVMLKFPVLDRAEHAGAIIAVFCAGMSIFLGFVWISIRFSSWTESSILGMLMAAAGILQFLWHYSIYSPLIAGVIASPLPPVLLMLLLLNRFWVVFDDRQRLNNLVGSPAMSLVESGNMQATREFYDEAFNAMPQKGSATAQWFLDLSDRLRPGHDQDWFYLRHRLLLMLRSSMMVLSPQRWLVFLSSALPVLLMVLLMNFEITYVYILFFAIWLSAFGMTAQEIHSPQLPYNRQDMARTEWLLSLINSAVSLSLCALALLILHGLDTLFFDRVSRIPPLSCLSYLFVACPLLHAIRMLIGNRPALGFAIFMGIGIIGQILYIITFPPFIAGGPVLWLSLYLAGWLLLIPVAYRRYCGQDLVSNAS